MDTQAVNNFHNTVERISLQGLKKTLTRKKGWGDPRASIRVVPQTQEDTRRGQKFVSASYEIFVDLYIRNSNGNDFRASVQVREDNSGLRDFLSGAMLDLGEDMSGLRSYGRASRWEPAQYIADAMAVTIANRCELIVISGGRWWPNKNDFVLELIYRKPLDRRVRRHRKMCGYASPEELKHFFRRKKPLKAK